MEETYFRQAAELVDLTVAGADGAEQVISGTSEHPFYVPAAKDYVAMGQLTPGTVLQTADGATATVKSSTRRAGQFDVYNFKVPGEHNYYVAAADGSGSVEGNRLNLPQKARKPFFVLFVPFVVHILTSN